MLEPLFIGKKQINLTEVDSTNSLMKELVQQSKNEPEGLVVTAKNQLQGRGQSGNSWEGEKNKNLTFSLYLKPNILAQKQFLISKVVALGMVDFLNHLEVKNVLIKWPNDIYCHQKKIAGILIENVLRKDKVYSAVVGIGLNVNQTHFKTTNHPTSIFNETGKEQDVETVLSQLLFFIEKRYIILKQGKEKVIDADYLELLLGLNKKLLFGIEGETIEGEIKGVNTTGQLQVLINNQLKEFGMQALKFLSC